MSSLFLSFFCFDLSLVTEIICFNFVEIELKASEEVKAGWAMLLLVLVACKTLLCNCSFSKSKASICDCVLPNNLGDLLITAGKLTCSL